VRFSVAVIDMDWHRVESVAPEYGSGWTGYSWERSLFPDPEGFLAELHDRGLRVTLNVHPADGVRGFEDSYAAMATALGRDPEDRLPIAFDITDPAFLEAYFDVLHHRLEEDGVDFWWLDWQQGPYSRVAGIDPLWMLNHFHFLDSGRDGRRPLTFSRYAGPGSHRYPVGFSGDTVITWASLAFQPEFTATASNIGYGWWSHDIGGHLWGVRDDELTLRWVQLGVWSPILRLHSSNNPFLAKEPWAFPAETRAAIDEALRLRVRLVPYLHTMNRRAAEEGMPLVLPLYYEAPAEPAAYAGRTVFRFGSELVVAPITAPRDPVTLQGVVTAWLPPGTWVDITTGIVHEGGRTVRLHRDTGGTPALLQAGGILPLAAEHETDATVNPTDLEVLVAPGADGGLVLVEDDGTGTTPDTVPTVRTALRFDQASGTLTVSPADGPSGVVPETRTWTITFLGLPADTEVRVDGGVRAATSAGAGRVSVTVTRDASAGLTVGVGPDPQPATQDVEARLFDLLSAAQYPYEAKAALWRTLTAPRSAAARIAELQALDAPESLLSALTELLTAR
jgi:alpha-glucosidase (family GH31 glycosyl hydrolase)